MANAALAPLLTDIEDETLLHAPVNALRLSLHPKGLAPRIINLPEWREHLLDRLRRQIAATRDDVLVELLQEVSAYPSGNTQHTSLMHIEYGGVLVPLKLATKAGPLSLLSTTTVFGTPRDVLLSELAIEAFFPADAETGALLRQSGDLQ
jgi:hypothetical protein